MKEAVEGRQGRGRPRSERARAAVLAAATDLLVSGQIDAVTMEAIAAKSGVSKSTIYKWWPSRAHVILESFFNRARYTMAVDENASLQEVRRRRKDRGPRALAARPASAWTYLDGLFFHRRLPCENHEINTSSASGYPFSPPAAAP